MCNMWYYNNNEMDRIGLYLYDIKNNNIILNII